MNEAENLAKQAAAIAADKKATRIVVMDLADRSDLCRYSVICSASNDRQTKAIAEAIETHFSKNLKVRPLAVEGRQSGHWILLDYGQTMVHIFFDYVRDYYALEAMWPDAKRVETLSATAAPASSAPQ